MYDENKREFTAKEFLPFIENAEVGDEISQVRRMLESDDYDIDANSYLSSLLSCKEDLLNPDVAEEDKELIKNRYKEELTYIKEQIL